MRQAHQTNAEQTPSNMYRCGSREGGEIEDLQYSESAKQAGADTKTAGTGEADANETEANPKPLTRTQANALREKLGNPSLESFLVKVLFWQVGCTVLVAAAAWFLSASTQVTFSAFYGALSVVLPSALVVRVVIWQTAASQTGDKRSSVGRLLGLEFVKVALTLCLLAAAPLVLGAPDWIALVGGFVVTLKVYGLVALRGVRQTKRVQNNWD